MVACPSESLKNARNALLEVERAEVESAHLALADDPADHVYRKLDTVVLYLLIIVLYIYRKEGAWNEWGFVEKCVHNNQRQTRIGTSSDMSCGGTLAPHSLIMRRKDSYVWIGMIAGMMGTVIPIHKD